MSNVIGPELLTEELIKLKLVELARQLRHTEKNHRPTEYYKILKQIEVYLKVLSID